MTRMMQSVETLREEHDAVRLVLAELERAVAAAEQGRPVAADVFVDIQEFFSVFVDRCHHHKEEAVVFPRLLAHEDGARLIRQLEAEHDAGRGLDEAFAAAVVDYRPGDAAAGGRLAAAARAYARALRQHIDAETTGLFPAMERALGHVDAEMYDRFERIEADELGPGTHERLHAMIERLPARIDASLAAGTGVSLSI